MARRRDPETAGAPCRLAALLALALALAAGRAAAQPATGPGADIEEVPLESLVDLRLEAASLHEERLSETAAAAFVLSGDDLRLQGFRTLSEVLQSVPGLFAYRDDLFPMVGVRGVGLFADYGTRVLLLVDGHPLNDSVGLGGTHLGRDLPVPLEAVKRVEIIQGPVGSVYGPTAFLSVVDIVTVGADDRASQLRLGAEGAQGQVRGAEASAVATGRAGEWALTAAVQGSAARGDDYRLPELTLPVPNRAGASTGLVRDADAARAASAFASVQRGGLHLSAAYAATSRRLFTAAYVSSVEDDRSRVSTRSCYLEAGYTRRLGPKLTLAARGAWDDALYRDAFAYPPPPAGDGVFRDEGRDRWVSADVRATWRPLEGTLAVAGVTGQLHRTVQRTWADGLPTLQDDPVDGVGAGRIPKDFGSVNAYLLLDHRLGRTVRLHLGATWFRHQLFGQRVTPKAALVWTATAQDDVKLIYSQGFRAPTVSEAFYDDSESYLANPRLRPEVVDAGEAIYHRRLGAVAQVTASAFLHRYTRLIRYETVPAPGEANPDPADPLDWRQQARNADSLWVRGAQLSATVRHGRWVTAWGGLSVQSTGPGTWANSPAFTGTLALSSRALWEPLAVSVQLSGMSAREHDRTNRPAGGADAVGPQLVVNAAALLDVPGFPGLSLELGVTNLLDTAAPDPLPADFTPVTSLPHAPRTLRLALRHHFQ